MFGSPFGPVFHHPDTPLPGLRVYPWNVRLWLEADIHPHCDLRPFYPLKQTLVALQSFGLKKRTSEVGSTRESGHKWLGRGVSAFDPKRTFNQFESVQFNNSETNASMVGNVAIGTANSAPNPVCPNPRPSRLIQTTS